MCPLIRKVIQICSEYNEEEEKLLLVMEKGDTDFATVIRTRTSLNAINPTLIRFYWQEMLEAVKEIHDKSNYCFYY
jgi:serine/threonine-protein kinase TTK/MPS1